MTSQPGQSSSAGRLIVIIVVGLILLAFIWIYLSWLTGRDEPLPGSGSGTEVREAAPGAPSSAPVEPD